MVMEPYDRQREFPANLDGPHKADAQAQERCIPLGASKYGAGPMNVDKLNWNDLKYFIVVARAGSLARAAEMLGVNHSTVFRRINTLEEALSANLFARLSDGYQLSEEGNDVLKYVDEMFARVNDIQRLLDSQNEALLGPINVTAPNNLAYQFLPGYIRDFQAAYPQININLLVTNTDCDLSRREADVAIRASSAPPDYLVGQRLFSLGWSAYAAPIYLAKYGRPASEAELADHKVISAHVDLTFLPAYRWLEKNIPGSRIVARSNDLVSMSALAVAGIGVAILPDDQAKPELERLFRVNFAPTSDIWVLIHPDMKRCRRLKIFRDYLLHRFREETLFRELAL